MSQPIKRKPLYWILIDLIATLLLLAGIFKLVELDIPYVTAFFRPFPANVLITTGAIISIVSMLMFLIPIIKANKAKQVTATVERTNR